jgi:hypothetical protein
VDVQRLVLAILLCVLVSNPLFSFADNFSDGVNAAIKPDNNEGQEYLEYLLKKVIRTHSIV